MKRTTFWLVFSVCFIFLASLPLSGNQIPLPPPHPYDPDNPEVPPAPPNIWRTVIGIGDWNDGQNWSGGVPGDNATDVYIDVGGIAEITNNAMTVGALYVASRHGGTVNHIDGVNVVDKLVLGANTQAVGVYNLGGIGSLGARVEECIGMFGTGVFNQTAGANSAKAVKIGSMRGSNGTYNLGGSGELKAETMYVGGDGLGTFNHTGGTVRAGKLYCGASPTGCAYTLSGAAKLTADVLELGSPGKKSSGQFMQLGGKAKIGKLIIHSGYVYFCKRGALSFQSLEIDEGGVLDVDVQHLDSFGMTGKSTAVLDKYVADGRIRDSARDYPPGKMKMMSAAYDEEKDSSGFTAYTNDDVVIPITSWIHGAAETGSWEDGGNWTADRPTEVAICQINNGGTAVIKRLATCFAFCIGELPEELLGQKQKAAAREAEEQSLNLRAKTKSGGTCALNGLSLTSRLEYIGSRTDAIFNQNGGVNTTQVALYVRGSESRSTGYNLSDGKLWVGHTLYIGDQGKGTFNQPGGLNTVEMGLFLVKGAYNLAHGGMLVVKKVEYAADMFNQTGGTNNVGGTLYVAGTYGLNGHSALRVDNSIYIGVGVGEDATAGNFSQTSGKAGAQFVYVGGGDLPAVYNLSGDGVLVAHDICVGSSTAKSRSGFCQLGGTVSADYLFIAGGGYVQLRGTLGINGLYIGPNGYLDIDVRKITGFRMAGNREKLLNLYIREGKIYDSTLDNKGDLLAVYDWRTGSTVLQPNTQPLPGMRDTTRWHGTADTATPWWELPANWSSGVPGTAGNARVHNGTTAVIRQKAGTHATFVGGTRPTAITLKGEHTTGYLFVGEARNTNGVYNASEGTLNAAIEYVGYQGAGTLNQSNAQNVLDQSLHLGFGPPSSGTYNLTDEGTLTVAGSIYAADGGHGIFTQADKSKAFATALNIGFLKGSEGSFNLADDALLALGQTVYVGNDGAGTFNQTGGVHQVGMILCVGGGKGSIYNLDKDSFLFVKRAMYVGYNGNGKFNQMSGKNAVGIVMYVDAPSNGEGVYSLKGGQLDINLALYIGCRAKGVFDQTGGAARVSGVIYVGAADTSGVYKLSGDGNLKAHELYLGAGGKRQNAGLFTQSGGTCKLEYLIVQSHGMYEMKDGTLKVRNLIMDSGGMMDIDIRKVKLLAFAGNQVALLKEYIGDGKIFDSALPDKHKLYAVYDAKSDTTTLATKDFIPAVPTGPFDDYDSPAPEVAGGGGFDITSDFTTDKFSADGNVTISSGTLTANEEESIGYTITQVGGTNKCANNLSIGADKDSPDSGGAYVLTEDGRIVVRGDVFVGWQRSPDAAGGKGEWIQFGGECVVKGTVNVGSGNTKGVVNILGGMLSVGDIKINNGIMRVDPAMAHVSVAGNHERQLNDYIDHGKIVGRTASDHIVAVYDRQTRTTTLIARPLNAGNPAPQP